MSHVGVFVLELGLVFDVGSVEEPSESGKEPALPCNKCTRTDKAP